MEAWILDESPGSYRWGSVDDPTVGPTDVAVTPKASALNHMDLWLTKGMPRPHLPHVPGCDVAGVISAVGADVSGWSIGDDVVINPAISCGSCPACVAGDGPLCPTFGILGEHRWGGHGDTVVVPAANVAARPGGLSWAEAAAYPLVYLTAHRMLERASVGPNDRVLVVGVGGGVASAAVALAHHRGAYVIGTSRDQAKLAAAESLGADETVSSDADRWPTADVVVDSVGPATWRKAVGCLAPGGRLVTCGGTSGPTVEVSLPRLFFKQHQIIGSTMGSAAEFAAVTDLVGRGVPVVVDSEIALADYPAALERLREGRQDGKIVLTHP